MRTSLDAGFLRTRLYAIKNWLFCDTPKGADSSAIVYTLVETAKANGLEPYAYLLQALTELPYLGKSPSQEDLNAFLRWSAKMQAACAARNTTTAGDLCWGPQFFVDGGLLCAYA